MSKSIHRMFLARVSHSVAATLLGAMAALAQDGSPASRPNPSIPAISVSEVVPEYLRDRIVASGFAAAVEQVQVQPLEEGLAIDELMAEVGDTVEAGQILARLSASALELERSELLASQARARADVAKAEAVLVETAADAREVERVLARTARLAKQGTVPQAQADTAAAALDAVQARVRAAEYGIVSAISQRDLVTAQIATLGLRLEQTEVRAPVSGLVVSRNAERGAISSATGTAMFTIVRDGAMELRAELAEQDLLRIRPGQRAVLHVIGRAEPLTGTVHLLEPSIDRATRLGKARIAIDAPGTVMEGMFLTADILVGEGKSLAVPTTAVRAGTDGPSVMRVDRGIVERIAVETGTRDGNMIGIADGLAVGDLVVTRAAAFVREGDRVNPIHGRDLRARLGQEETFR